MVVCAFRVCAFGGLAIVFCFRVCRVLVCLCVFVCSFLCLLVRFAGTKMSLRLFARHFAFCVFERACFLACLLGVVSVS